MMSVRLLALILSLLALLSLEGCSRVEGETPVPTMMLTESAPEVTEIPQSTLPILFPRTLPREEAQPLLPEPYFTRPDFGAALRGEDTERPALREECGFDESGRFEYKGCIIGPNEANQEPQELVRAADYIPDLRVELRFASENNITGQTVYDFTDAWLRYSTLLKLQKAREALNAQGYDLLVWDAFCPETAEETLWLLLDDDILTVDPSTGHSSHCAGSAVDVTLVSLDGSAVEMPSDYTDRTGGSYASLPEAAPMAREHESILRTAMEDAGFTSYQGAWWHFTDKADPTNRYYTVPNGEYCYEDLQHIVSLSGSALHSRVREDIPYAALSTYPYGPMLGSVIGSLDAGEDVEILGYCTAMGYPSVRVRAASGVEGYVAYDDLTDEA